jgi:hypothetical protein
MLPLYANQDCCLCFLNESRKKIKRVEAIPVTHTKTNISALYLHGNTISSEIKVLHAYPLQRTDNNQLDNEITVRKNIVVRKPQEDIPNLWIEILSQQARAIQPQSWKPLWSNVETGNKKFMDIVLPLKIVQIHNDLRPRCRSEPGHEFLANYDYGLKRYEHLRQPETNWLDALNKLEFKQQERNKFDAEDILDQTKPSMNRAVPAMKCTIPALFQSSMLPQVTKTGNVECPLNQLIALSFEHNCYHHR